MTPKEIWELPYGSLRLLWTLVWECFKPLAFFVGTVHLVAMFAKFLSGAIGA